MCFSKNKNLLSVVMLLSAGVSHAANINGSSKINELYFTGYHNTYAHFDEYQNGTDKYINDLSHFLDNYRSIELDVWESAGVQYISHDLPIPARRDSNCENDHLDRCLVKIVNYVRDNKEDKRPLLLGIEVKWGFKQVNAAAREVVNNNPDIFYTPADMITHFKSINDSSIIEYGRISLREAIRAHGWPTIDELGDKKIIIYYTGGGAGNAKDNNKRIGGYIKQSLITQDHGAGVGFPCPTVTKADQVYPHKYWIDGEGESEYLICNSIKWDSSNINSIAITSNENNFLLRAWDSTKRDHTQNYQTAIDLIKRGVNIYDNETKGYVPLTGSNGASLPVVGKRSDLL